MEEMLGCGAVSVVRYFACGNKRNLISIFEFIKTNYVVAISDNFLYSEILNTPLNLAVCDFSVWQETDVNDLCNKMVNFI